MSTELNVAFWNVQNLFEPGTVDRGPDTPGELDAKLDVLAEVINGFFGDAGPDLMGVAEIGTDRIFRDLLKRLNGPYHTVWKRPGMSEQTGLGLFARQSMFADLGEIDVYRPSVAARPRSVIARCELAGGREPFVIAVNHWKSRMGTPALVRYDQAQTADWLGDYLANRCPRTCALVIGDFNAEPYEAPFGELRLRGRRTFSNALWSNATPAYLYNSAWKFMTEPDSWEVASTPGYQEPRPKTTYGKTGANVFDHLLVSGGALRNGPLTLREDSVEFHCDQSTSRHNRNGVLYPRPWDASTREGSSDHFPLLATFTVN